MSSPISRPAALESCACFNVRGAARAVTALYEETLAPSGLRANQFAILAALGLGGATSKQELARSLELDQSTMTRTLAPLADEGLVESRRGSDRRVHELALTQAGTRKLAEAGRLWKRAQERLRATVGDEVFERLLADLPRVTSALRTSEPPES